LRRHIEAERVGAAKGVTENRKRVETNVLIGDASLSHAVFHGDNHNYRGWDAIDSIRSGVVEVLVDIDYPDCDSILLQPSDCGLHLAAKLAVLGRGEVDDAYFVVWRRGEESEEEE